ncbi:MAG TPA: hypothetical protein VGJ37_07080 [Pyrinomonadaceae bacterium]|jgi:hypothetical protein
MSAARARLPGFRFETQAPPLDEVLPRMDIAAFVGFAASGPLQTPVAIESEAQFAAIFGEDVPLAWDVVRGEQVSGYLGPAVRSFFHNGGRRCWVVRVARLKPKPANDLNYARSNYFPIPALGRAKFADQQLKGITPAFARARSEGSWSDSLRVSAALLSRSIQVNSLKLPSGPADVYEINIDRVRPESTKPCDLFRMTFKDAGQDDRYTLFVAVEPKPLAESSPPPALDTLDLIGRKAVWFESLDSLPAPGTIIATAIFTREFDPFSGSSDVVEGFSHVYDAVLNPHLTSPPGDDVPAIQRTGELILKLVDCEAAAAPPAGSVIRIDLPGGSAWLTVDELVFSAGASATAFVTGRAFQQIDPPVAPLTLSACECLTFELWVRNGEEYSISLSDLGFVPGHERFWGLLPTDLEVYGDTDPTDPENPATLIWRQVGDLFRFPLAGDAAADQFFFPLAMPALPENFLGPVILKASELERDGLAAFDSTLFLDPDLIDTFSEDLQGEADYIRYTAPQTRSLHGIHAVMALDEPTIIAAPDAVHRGWSKSNIGQPPLASGPTSPLRPEWWHFLDCHESPPDDEGHLQDCEPQPPKPSPIKAVAEPLWGNFLDCGIKVIAPPHLHASETISTTGTFSLFWQSSPPDTAANYVLESSSSPDFTDPETIYSGPRTNVTLYGQGDGDYFYRVKAVLCCNSSDWSNGVAVRVATKTGFRLHRQEDYTNESLLAVQRALLRMCAVRGDLFAVLSLPEHYREDDSIEYVRELKSTPDKAAPTEDVFPLGFAEANDFSYGAIFHPWLIDGEKVDGNNFRRTPPCGAVSGVIANRSLFRGAWIAPANQPLSNVVALSPVISRERYLDLQEARINLVRQEPRGFIVLDADTLCDDPSLRPINVRRLLSLLRRLALRLGATYVFEPNSPAFRRLVERGFTEMLDLMFVRGAFAGTTPATSYQVVTDDSLNTEQSVDQGRFIVELRVAPSLPMTFLTIRLIQDGSRTSVTEGR